MDMYSLHGTKWDEGARWAHGGSGGRPIVYFHGQVRGRKQGAKWDGHSAGSKYVPNGNSAPGGVKNTRNFKKLLHARAYSPLAFSRWGSHAETLSDKNTRVSQFLPDFFAPFKKNINQ